MIATNAVSVGIPVFNQADTIAETIDSLLAQTVPPAEIVIAENHSTDGTAMIVEKYSSRVKIVRPDRHLGMTENWNFCVRQLQAPWFALLSGDDLARTNYIESLQRGANADADAVLVRGGWDTIDATGKTIQRRRLLSVRPVVRPPQTLMEQLYGPKHSFAAFALKKDVWESVGGFPESLKLFSDWGMWLRMAPKGSFVYQDEIISGYRDRPRPSLDVARLIVQAEDERTILRHVMPGVGLSAEIITKVGQVRLKRYLQQLHKQRANIPIARIDPIMTTLASEVDLPEWWDSWKRGWVPRQSLSESIRHLARTIFSSLRR